MARSPVPKKISAYKIEWENGKIIFERCYQQLDGDFDYWTDSALEEIMYVK